MPSLYLNSWFTSVYCNKRKIEIRILNKESGNTDIHYVPFDDIDRVIVCGNPTISTQVIAKLLKQDVPFHFISTSGSWRGTLYGHVSGNAARRINQVRKYDSGSFREKFASAILFAKFQNSRRVIQRLAGNRQMNDNHAVKYTLFKLKEAAESLEKNNTLDQLRGIEGYAAAEYFSGLALFFPQEFTFDKRSRRPPLNEANALMSWTYTIVQSEIEASIRLHNLDPFVGFFHDINYNAPSLSLDILEVFRAPVCDMLTLKLFNHKIMRNEYFEKSSEDQGVFLNEAGRKVFFGQYERHMTRSFSTLPDGEHTTFRKLIDDTVINICKVMNDENNNFSFFKAP